MPDKAFAQSIQIAGEGYNAKLQGLMAIGQSIVHSETVKRQMADQLQAQKTLIDYRADAEVRKQEKLAEMRAPAEQMKMLADSRKDATAKLDRLLERQSKDYFDVTSNNLNPFAPFVNINPSTGLYDLFIGNTETGDLVDYQTYLSDMDTLKADLAVIKDLKNVLSDLPEESPDVREDGLDRGVLNRTIAQEYISRWNIAKTSEEKRGILNDLTQNWQYPTATVSDDSRGTGDTSNHVSLFARQVNSLVNEQGTIPFVAVERQSGFVNAIRNKIGGHVPEVMTFDFQFNGKPISFVRQQLEEMYDVFGLSLTELNKLDDATRAQIYAGDRRGLGGEAKKMAETVKTILEDDILAESFQRFNRLYNGFNLAVDEYSRKTPFDLANFNERDHVINTTGRTLREFITHKGGDVTRQALFELGSQQ